MLKNNTVPTDGGHIKVVAKPYYYSSFWMKTTTGSLLNNNKYFRMGTTQASQNVVMNSNSNNTSKVQMTIEYAVDGNAVNYGTQSPASLTTWKFVEVIIDNVGNKVQFYFDGVLKNEILNRLTGDEFSKSPYLGYGYWYSTTYGIGNGWYFDNTYIDYTPARVMLCTGSPFTSRGQCEMQIPTSWGSGSITAQPNKGIFPSGSSAYLYVVNDNGEYSDGKLVTVGSGGSEAQSVQSTNPVDGATGITPNSTNSISFAKNVDCSTAADITISHGTRSITCSGAVATLTTSGQPTGTDITVTVPATVKDTSGNPMDAPVSFTYTTSVPSATCDTDNSLCPSEDTCVAAWPEYSWCPYELPACKPSACTDSCDVDHLSMCTESECLSIDLTYYEGACRDAAQDPLVTGPNLITNPNLTLWATETPNMPTGWTSYKGQNVRRDPLGVRLWDGGHILQANKLEANTKYFYAYNYLKGTSTAEVSWYDSKALSYTTGTKTGVFTTGPAPLPDHGIYFYAKAAPDLYLNDFVLKNVNDVDCTNDFSLCQTPTTCEVAGYYYWDNGCQGVAPSILNETFADGDATGWSTVNQSTPGTPSWSVVNQQYKQANDLKGFDQSYHLGSYAYWTAGTAWDDYRVWATITPIDSPARDTAGLMFRYTDQNNYYRLSLSRVQGFYRLEKKVDGVFSTIAVTGRGPLLESQEVGVEVNGSNIIIEVNGQPLFSTIDTSLTTGTIALYNMGPATFDNIAVEVVDTLPKVVLSSPIDYQVLTGNTITASAVVNNLPENGYIVFSLDGVAGDPITAAPFTEEFASLSDGDHTILVSLYVDEENIESSDNRTFATGGISIVAIGDSITNGTFDDISADNISSNNRNISRGFTPILTGWLETNLNKPAMIYNSGIGGIKSYDGSNNIQSEIDRYPGSEYFLILYGTNDATNTLFSPPGNTCTEANFLAGLVECDGTYKAYMRDIVMTLKDAGKFPLLALVPYNKTATSTELTRIQNYNAAIAQLINEHNLLTDAPDLYSHFETNQDQLIDNVHPNGIGYQSVANKWYEELTNYWTGVFEPNRASVIHATIH
jgi:lysophospholipase L1-like esterase